MSAKTMTRKWRNIEAGESFMPFSLQRTQLPVFSLMKCKTRCENLKHCLSMEKFYCRGLNWCAVLLVFIQTARLLCRAAAKYSNSTSGEWMLQFIHILDDTHGCLGFLLPSSYFVPVLSHFIGDYHCWVGRKASQGLSFPPFVLMHSPTLQLFLDEWKNYIK